MDDLSDYFSGQTMLMSLFLSLFMMTRWLWMFGMGVLAAWVWQRTRIRGALIAEIGISVSVVTALVRAAVPMGIFTGVSPDGPSTDTMRDDLTSFLYADVVFGAIDQIGLLTALAGFVMFCRSLVQVWNSVNHEQASTEQHVQ